MRIGLLRLLAFVAAGVILLLTITPLAASEEVVRRAIDADAYAILKHGRTIGLEVDPPRGGAARGYLSRYLGESSVASYREGVRAFVPLERLLPNVRRKVLLTLFPNDVVDSRGWVHTVTDDHETLWSLSEWITGSGSNYKSVMRDPRNGMKDSSLRRGQRIVFSVDTLHSSMQRPTVGSGGGKSDSVTYAPKGDLRYGSDASGDFAIYKLKRGESLYSAVAVRFTHFRDHKDIVAACDAIARRSGIGNMNDLRIGQDVRIPVNLLAGSYRPGGGPAASSTYAEPVSKPIVAAKSSAAPRDLSDVLIILDAGHGGLDTGAKHLSSGLYEDELNYDIMIRIKDLLEKETNATVVTTIYDRSSGLKAADRTRFANDQDEQLNTTPPHRNDESSSVSANLRWMLVNSIYDKHIRNNGDPSKVLFTSIHTDSLYDSRLRGAMIYTPGAQLRRSEETRTDRIYAVYAEGRQYNRFVSTASERRRDEALSRSFANVLLDNLGRRRIKRHDQGDPIRSQIRRSSTRSYVPAVLRNTKVPTKILIETANLKNSTDRKRLADPWWRQQFAIAYVDAVKEFYRVNRTQVAARAD